MRQPLPSPDPSGAELRQQLTREQARLAALERETEAARESVRRLHAALAAAESAPLFRLPASLPPPGAVPRTSGEKVALFRSLFRGRLDVFPVHWSNPRTGKSGYAPACANKFIRGVCGLPKVKCGECPNQRFVPWDDEAVVGHLRGQHLAGAYPLLEDDSCFLLAMDFDGTSWREDVRAVAQVSREVGAPGAIERSKSGDGAHLWFFFDGPVPARVARQLGAYILSEAMRRRHQLSFASYDRLFPNQDTLPKGGFGNLIALPLQRAARAHGNSVFLDDALEPYPDQWAYLASLRRLSPLLVERLTREAAAAQRVLPVRWVPEPLEDEPARSPRTPRQAELAGAAVAQAGSRSVGPLPATVRSTLAEQLIIPTAGLPSALLLEFKSLAAFQNPEFYQRERLRLSTALTPRIIHCAQTLPDAVALPRGCLEAASQLLHAHGSALDVADHRATGTPLELTFQGTLTPVQAQAQRALLEHGDGVVVAPPGTGKTVLGAAMIAARGVSTLVLVHRQPLLEQWVAQLAAFLGKEPKAIGQLGGGKTRLTGQLDVAMLQSISRKEQLDPVLSGYGQVIVDECHHLPAFTFERVLAQLRPRFVLGLTATFQRRDGHHPILEMQLGPVRFTAPKSAATQARLERRLVVRESQFQPPESAGEKLGIQALYGALAADCARNGLIRDDVLQALEEGRSPLLLTERKEHLAQLAALLKGFAKNIVMLHGGGGAKARREAQAQLEAIPPDEERLLLATGRYIGEGFDDPRLDTLILAMPIAWKGTLTQYAGRLHRTHQGKRDVRIYDYVDRRVPVLARMFEKRLRGYRALGYAPEAPGTLLDHG